MDVASDIDERPRRLFRLDNQTGPDAGDNSIFRTDILSTIRLCLVSIVSDCRDSETATKDHVIRISRYNRVYNHGSPPDRNFREIVLLYYYYADYTIWFTLYNNNYR